ncbi:MAG: hypothetical protein ACLRZZ_02810 [Enterocloster sp.]
MKLESTKLAGTLESTKLAGTLESTKLAGTPAVSFGYHGTL